MRSEYYAHFNLQDTVIPRISLIISTDSTNCKDIMSIVLDTARPTIFPKSSQELCLVLRMDYSLFLMSIITKLLRDADTFCRIAIASKCKPPHNSASETIDLLSILFYNPANIINSPILRDQSDFFFQYKVFAFL